MLTNNNITSGKESKTSCLLIQKQYWLNRPWRHGIFVADRLSS